MCNQGGASRMIYAAAIAVPIPGINLDIRHGQAGVRRIHFPPARTPGFVSRSSLAAQAAVELWAYFEDPTRPFSIALACRGSPFQRRVWHTLTLSAPGEAVTSVHLARRLGTGAACRANPVPAIIP